MPFMEVYRPSIQLGLLKALAAAHGFEVGTLHAYLDLAARIGIGYYQELGEQSARLVGEWLFAAEAFPDSAPDPDGRYAEEFAATLAGLGGSERERADRLRHTRRHDVPAHLDRMLAAVPWQDVRVVGFTSSFQQNTASFALARRLKQRWPHLVTVFGGANFDGEMGLELVRSVDCVDLAVIGEADSAFPELLAALAAGEDPAAVPGVARREGTAVVAAPPRPPLRRLDDLPAPDYADYFDQAQAFGVLTPADRPDIGIPIETARGCWWGARHHCTFCGLNGSTMDFRAKSPRRVRAELAELAGAYGSFRFQAVDNILDMAYLGSLFRELADAEAGYELFYEVKANLTRAQLRTLAAGGVRHVQPGIESLSSHVLALMRKGVRAAQNVNTLRWARYYGMRVEWNLLWGFPGETEQDYRAQAEVMPHLVHLQPPAAASGVSLERFSPLFTEDLGVRWRAPRRTYRRVYPPGVDLERVAYFFEHELRDPLPAGAYAGVRAAAAAWSAAWAGDRTPELTYRSAPGLLQVHDARHEAGRGTYTFRGPLAAIYLACSDRPRSAAAVRAALGLDWPTEQVAEAFAEFAARGLMFLDGTVALALALPATPGR